MAKIPPSLTVEEIRKLDSAAIPRISAVGLEAAYRMAYEQLFAAKAESPRRKAVTPDQLLLTGID